jgi:hypothetical protein
MYDPSTLAETGFISRVTRGALRYDLRDYRIPVAIK